MQGDKESVGGRRSDTESVVGTETHEPNNAVVGCDEEMKVLPLDAADLEVFEEVAHQTGMIHAEGLETVGLAPRTQREGEREGVGIDCDSMDTITKRSVGRDNLHVDHRHNGSGVRGDKKVTFVTFGDMRRGIEEAAGGVGGKYIGHLGRVKAIGMELFEEECRERETGRGKLAKVDGEYLKRKVREKCGPGFDKASREFVDIGTVEKLGVVEPFYIGGHGAVNRGVELAEQWHETVAYAVAAGIKLGISNVFDIAEVVFDHVGIDFGSGEAEERPDYREFGVRAAERQSGAGTDAVEAGDAGATEKVKEEGLDGVVAMVRSSHARVTMVETEVGKEGIAQLTGRLLDREAMGDSVGTGVERDGVESHAVGIGEVGDELLVTVTIARPKIEIAMGNGKRNASGMGKVCHDHRITSTTNGKQHLPPRREEVLLVDVV